jgi:hypothetical protein
VRRPSGGPIARGDADAYAIGDLERELLSGVLSLSFAESEHELDQRGCHFQLPPESLPMNLVQEAVHLVPENET